MILNMSYVVALYTGITFHQVWSRSTYPFLTVLLIRYVTLWPQSLTFDVERFVVSAVTWSNSVPNLSEIEQSTASYWDFNMSQFGRRPPLCSWLEVDSHNSNLPMTCDPSASQIPTWQCQAELLMIQPISSAFRRGQFCCTHFSGLTGKSDIQGEYKK